MIQIGAKYKFGGPKNPQTDYTNSIVLDVDSAGNPTRVLGLGGVEELSDAQVANLSKRFVLTKVSDGPSTSNPSVVGSKSDK